MCPELMEPENGVITFSGTNSEFMTMAMYSCNSGYGLSGGDTVRTCETGSNGGIWSGTEPICVGECV